MQWRGSSSREAAAGGGHMHSLLGLTAVLLLMTGIPRPAQADGIPISFEATRIEMPAQRAIIVWDAERRHEDLILSVQLLGGPEAAWVVPVPSLPEVKAASSSWFARLSHSTQPKIETRVEYVYPAMGCARSRTRQK